MKEQLALIHEMFGNPVASVDKARRWSKGIVSLASACYDGEDCVFALGDALDDEDHHLVAEHFRFGSHPKGCWALDLILGKK